MSTTAKEKALTIWRIIKRTLLFLFLFQLFYILLLKWVDPPFTLTQMGSLFGGNGLKRDYVHLKEVSSYARLSFIAAEDQRFPDHNGFDWKSINKAMEYNKKKPNRIKGASTISQQVAKNVFLWQGRSWFRKGLEVYFTFMIELLWGKNRIMEMYLNVSEMGPGIFGIESAAQNYFKKPAKKLTRSEAAMIASCMPNPKKYTVKPLSRYVATRYPWVMKQMVFLQNDPDIQKILQ
jgi:monofunctional biosynthetic peptidoglycan transglycosylase